MRVFYSKKLPRAFVIDECQLEKLTKLLQHRVGEVSFGFSCVDGLRYEFEAIKDLIAYENSKLKKIYGIRLHAQSDKNSRSAEIIFNDQGISIDFAINKDGMLGLRDALQNILEGTRPWYSWIVRFRNLIHFIFGSITVVVGTVSFSRLKILENIEHGGELLMPLVLLVFFSFVMGYVVSRLTYGYFPEAVFLIGQEKSRYKHLSWIQKLIIASIIGLLIALIPFLIQAII